MVDGKNGWLSEMDKADIGAVLDNARRGIRAAVAFLKAAEGPHDSPFTDERNELDDLEKQLHGIEQRVDTFEPHIPSPQF